MITSVKFSFNTQSGYILLEAMITIVVLAFGLLGLAGVQSRMQAAEMESYQRAQALVLLDDMAARINAKRGNASSYVTSGLTPAYLGVGDAQVADCSGVAFGAARDLCQWSGQLKGSSETSGGGANVGAMINARGCVAEEVPGAVPLALRVVVIWQGLVPSAAPALVCGTDAAYGDNASATGYRRAISKTIVIPNLTPP
jgi:type IV pilus assembly protein PilV